MAATAPAGVDPELYAQALAEVRALPSRARAAQLPARSRAVTRPRPACCTGDRNGYQQHQRRHEEACPPARAAAAEYNRNARALRRAKPYVEPAKPYVEPADRPAEWARMAADLATRGHSLPRIAADLCVSEDTVRALLGAPRLELAA